MSQSRETYLIGWGVFFIGKSSAVGRVPDRFYFLLTYQRVDGKMILDVCKNKPVWLSPIITKDLKQMLVPKTGSRHYPAATSPKYHVHSKPSLSIYLSIHCSIYLSIYVSAYVPDRFETHSPWFPFSNGRFGFDIFWHTRNRRVTARFKACIFYMYIIYKYIQIPRLYVCVYILTYKTIETRVCVYI